MSLPRLGAPRQGQAADPRWRSGSEMRAPKEHGQILAVPPLADVGALLARSQAGVLEARITPDGPTLGETRDLARREVLLLASAYHQEAGETVPDAISPIWLVAGHQPELFHPGVWFKNFALNHLARAHCALPLNLIIDTDAAKPAVLHAPCDGRIARVPFDRTTGDTAYEERTVVDEAMFAGLPERMAPIMANYGFKPMLPAFWAEAVQQAKRTPLLGERFAAARRHVERRFGCVQRELPMSRVCGTEAFAWFACAILERLPAFHAIYNDVVRDYRRIHGIKSVGHPVPELGSDGAWLEAPFWAWRPGQGRRGKLMVRQTASTWELRAAGEDWPGIPRANAAGAIAAWRDLQRSGHKIRTRALTTTMFARLFLADLFIHGIGGGLYDELTDRIIERFCAIPAPPYLVLSATLLLPLPRFADAESRVRELGRRLRDIVYKPELFVAPGPATTPLIEAKQAWIAGPVGTHIERVERFHHIREINAQLLSTLGPLEREVVAERVRQQEHAAWDKVAARRDYGFCLYPEAMLGEFFTAFLPGARE